MEEERKARFVVIGANYCTGTTVAKEILKDHDCTIVDHSELKDKLKLDEATKAVCDLSKALNSLKRNNYENKGSKYHK